MLDIKFIKENRDLIKDAARKKNVDVDIDALMELDKKRIELLGKVEKKRESQNKASDDIASGTGDKEKLVEEMKALKEDLQKEEKELKEIMVTWRDLMLKVPNIPDMSVPEGTGEEDNKEIRVWGSKPEFTFTPKTQMELLEKHNMADFERGSKVAGFRGYFLKNDGAKLSLALWQFAMDFLESRGFEPMIVPAIVKKEAMMGTGYLPGGEDDLYRTQDDTYLSGTAEVPVMAYFMDETLKKEDLPKKMLAFSPCYRREAGAHGKDTKGLVRVHEFFKLEQVVLCEASHEESVKLHEEITKNVEELMKKLEIPYRVVINCGGDLGLGQVKKYDIETWVPSENKYRELHSSSYFHDFQTRRLSIKYRDSDGKLRLTHSLNSTALPTPRALVSIIENFQQEDGSIKIPKALHKYFDKKEIS